jgi:hypothetical protein
MVDGFEPNPLCHGEGGRFQSRAILDKSDPELKFVLIDHRAAGGSPPRGPQFLIATVEWRRRGLAETLFPTQRRLFFFPDNLLKSCHSPTPVIIFTLRFKAEKHGGKGANH